jgi:hypothetical protein
MAKAVKKVDPKMTAKVETMALVKSALEAQGLEVLDGVEFGMTSGTLVVRTATCDVQLKPIAPKAGVERYAVVEEEATEA